MKRQVKYDLINKLLNQQTIVQNSDKEVDFRRAEVTSQLVKMILEVENAPETLELIGGMDEAKGSDSTSVTVYDSETKEILFVSDSKESKEVEVTKGMFEELKNKPKGKTFKEKVIEAIKEAGKALSSKEIREAINFEGTDSNLSVRINNILRHITKSPNNFKTLNDRGRFVYGLKELETPEPIKENKDKKEPKKNELHLKRSGAKTNSTLVYRVEANDSNRRLTITVGDEVKFRNVLGSQAQGVIVAMNIPGRNSYKGEYCTVKTVTIEENGSLFDRRLDQIIKVIK
jgi:hypothetical protein